MITFLLVFLGLKCTTFAMTAGYFSGRYEAENERHPANVAAVLSFLSALVVGVCGYAIAAVNQAH